MILFIKIFYIKGHVLYHIGIVVTESIGIGLLYVGAAVSGWELQLEFM